MRYFERIAQMNDIEVWRKGLNTAQEWLRLINTTNISETEISALIGVVHANKHRTSGWSVLAGGVYNWVCGKGYPVSPPEVFFVPEGLPNNTEFFSATPLEHARVLIALFEQHHREDPSSEAWTFGMDVVREWLMLIESQDIKRLEISALVDKVFENNRKYSSMEWFHVALGVSNWCNQIGCLELIPEKYRSLVERQDRG